MGHGLGQRGIFNTPVSRFSTSEFFLWPVRALWPFFPLHLFRKRELITVEYDYTWYSSHDHPHLHIRPFMLLIHTYKKHFFHATDILNKQVGVRVAISYLNLLITTNIGSVNYWTKTTWAKTGSSTDPTSSTIYVLPLFEADTFYVLMIHDVTIYVQMRKLSLTWEHKGLQQVVFLLPLTSQ